MKSLVTAFVTAICFCLSEATAQSVLFDFDNAPLHSPLPVDLTVGGITAHFSASPAYYNYSIQRADVLGFTPVGFAGYCIYPNTIYACDLLISFDRTLSDVSILYAPEEYDTDSSCTMRITAYLGTTFVGTNTYTIPIPGTWPTGTLSFSSTQPFNNVVIHYDQPPITGGDYGPIFMADNLWITEAQVPTALDAVSRKTHGGAGTFNIDLPLSGTPGIECRTGGGQGDYEVIVTFSSPVTVDNVAVTSGTGTVGGYNVSGAQVTINLTGVANAQTINIKLIGINGGASSVDVPMSILIGDTSGNGSVNAGDVAQTKAQSGQAVMEANFRTDVNDSGSISAADVALVKSHSGSALP
jgi:Dockerin type I domain